MNRNHRYFNLKSVRRTRRGRIIMLSIVMMLIAVASFFVYQKLLNYYADELIGSTIKQTVDNRSDGFYIMSYDSIAIDLASARATLFNFRIDIDSSKINDNINKKTIFATSMSRAYVDIANIYLLAFKRRAYVNKLTFESPILYISNAKGVVDLPSVSSESTELYERLSREINALDIEDFSLDNARIHFKRGFFTKHYSFIANDVSFKLEGFAWDEKETTQDLSSTKFHFLMVNQAFKLADSVHILKVDSLWISSNTASIEGRNVEVRPESTINLGLNTLRKEDKILIKIPQFSIKGINLKNSDQKGIIQIDSVIINYPRVALESFGVKETNKKKQQSNRSKNLRLLAAKLFNGVRVDEVKLQNGKVNLIKRSDNITSTINANNIGARIKNLALDTLVYSKLQNYLNYDSIDLEVANYYTKLPDSVHAISFNRLLYSTGRHSNLEIDSIELFVIPKINRRSLKSNSFNILVPEAKFRDFELDQWLSDKALIGDSIYLKNPDISLYLYGNESDTANLEISKNLFSSIDVRLVSAFKSRLKVFKKNQIIVSANGLDANLYQIKLNDEENTLSIDKQQFDINANYLKTTSSNNLAFEAKNLKLFRKNTSWGGAKQVRIKKGKRWQFDLFDIAIPLKYIDRQGFDAMYDHVDVENFEFTMNVQSPKLKKNTSATHPDFSLKNFHLKKGTVTIVNDSSTLLKSEMKNVKFSTLKLTNKPLVTGLSFTGNIEELLLDESTLKIDKFKLDHKTNNFVMEAISIANSKLRKIDKITIGAIDINQALAGNGLQAKSLTIDHSEINLASSTKSEKFSFEEIAKKIKASIGPFKIGQLIGNDVVINHPKIQIEPFSFSFKNVDITRDKINGYRVPFVYSATLNIPKIAYSNNDFKLSVENIRMQPNFKTSTGKVAFEATKKQITVTSEGLNFGIPNLISLLENDKLHFEHLQVVSPVIQLREIKKNEKKSQEKFLPINIDKLELTNADVYFNNKVDLQLKNYNVTAFDFSLNNSKNNNFSYDQFLINGQQLDFNTPDGIMHITIHNVNANRIEKTLFTSRININPNYSKIELGRKVGYETDWIKAGVQSVEAHGLNFKELIEGEEILLPVLTINQAKLSVYRNKKLADPPKKEKMLLQDQLMSISQKFDIPKLNIKDSEISYSEMAEEGNTAGTITFNDFNIVAENVTNINNRIAQNAILKVDGSANVMNETPFKFAMAFDMKSPKQAFTLNGTIGQGDLGAFNEISKNNAFIEVKGGEVEKLTFNVKANEHSAYGTMQFRYNDLKISILNKEKEKAGLGKSITSFFANTFVINKNNPRLYKLREGKIFFERNPYKSIFNYWTKSFLSGIVSSVGLTNNEKEYEEAKEEVDNNE